MKKRVAVGMSGGVDSSVAAALLVQAGYEVEGVFIEAYNEPGCRTDDDRKDALRVATKLGIPFTVLDYKKEYKEKVVEYFIKEYEAGRTPNPDVVCNREVKFGLFYDWALRHAQGKQPFDYVATGHYARILAVTKLHSDTVTRMLQQPRDLSKDQTYFLWQIKQDHLQNIIFPLGDLFKKEVRNVAKNLGFLNADKPDSMGVCMMGELNVREFLKGKLSEKLGNVLMNGKVVGTHKGMWFSTVGERVGQEIMLDNQALKKMGLDTTRMPVLYVVAKDKAENILRIGIRENCETNEFMIDNLIIKNDEKEMFVRIRNLGELTRVVRVEKGRVITTDKVFAPAEGQSAVFYDQAGVVVGGGIIQS